MRVEWKKTVYLLFLINFWGWSQRGEREDGATSISLWHFGALLSLINGPCASNDTHKSTHAQACGRTHTCGHKHAHTQTHTCFSIHAHLKNMHRHKTVFTNATLEMVFLIKKKKKSVCLWEPFQRWMFWTLEIRLISLSIRMVNSLWLCIFEYICVCIECAHAMHILHNKCLAFSLSRTFTFHSNPLHISCISSVFPCAWFYKGPNVFQQFSHRFH